jgi:hypothetical protein
VLIGAGIPARFPALLDRHAVMEGAALPVPWRPRFLAIVSSAILATFLARNSAGRGPSGGLMVAGGFLGQRVTGGRVRA